jgi:hypothetical protein
MTFAGTDDVRAFESMWNQIAEAALSPPESAEFIAELVRE